MDGVKNNEAGPPPYYPVFLNLRGRKAVVVGGGRVARGKVDGLVEAGAVVTVVATAAEPMPAGVTLISRAFRVTDLDGAWLAVAATDDPVVNSAVARAAEARRIFVNVVDTPAECSYILPSVLRRGLLRIAVSTSGASPSLAGRIRRKLEPQFGPEYAALADLLWELRRDWEPRARAAQLSYEQCFQAWSRVLDLPLIDILRDEGRAAGRQIALETLDFEIIVSPSSS